MIGLKLNLLLQIHSNVSTLNNQLKIFIHNMHSDFVVRVGDILLFLGGTLYFSYPK